MNNHLEKSRRPPAASDVSVEVASTSISLVELALRRVRSNKQKGKSMSAASDGKSTPKSENAGAEAQVGASPGISRAALRYVDRPDCNETFADSISRLSFDGQTLRIDFAVARMDETSTGREVTGRLYPACRLVLTPSAAADLMQKLQQVTAALAQARTQKQARSQPGRASNEDDRSAQRSAAN